VKRGGGGKRKVSGVRHVVARKREKEKKSWKKEKKELEKRVE
jgi:hypothetical protein